MDFIETDFTHSLLPAFVVGYDLGADSYARATALQDNLPDWLFNVDHQMAGWGCLHASIVGCVMRFLDNTQFSVGDVNVAIDGLYTLAADDSKIMRNRFPELEQIRYCGQNLYEREHLDVIWQFVNRTFRTPCFDDGYEAFLWSIGTSENLEFFSKWAYLSKTSEQHEALDLFEVSYLKVYRDSALRLKSVSPHGFDSLILEELKAIGDRIGEEDLKIFLLWDNSD